MDVALNQGFHQLDIACIIAEPLTTYECSIMKSNLRRCLLWSALALSLLTPQAWPASASQRPDVLATAGGDATQRHTDDEGTRTVMSRIGKPLRLAGAPAGSPGATATTLPTLPVRVLPGTDPSILNDLENIRPVKGTAPAVLQFDLAHKRILDASGQVVVEAAGSNPIYLQATVDKWRYLESLTALAAAHPQPMRVDFGRNSRSQLLAYAGEEAIFIINNVTTQRELVVFNISPIGTIQTLYVKDKAGPTPGDTVYFDAVASAPFGSDNVIAISAADPARMHDLIAWMQETANAKGMLDTRGAFLDQVTALKDVRVSVILIYTCLSPSKCARQVS
jgi:hypothetical protein